LPYVISTLAVASMLGRSWCYLHYGPDWGVAALALTPCRADALMIGVLGALMVRAPRLRSFLATRPWPLHLAVTIFGLGVAVLSWKEWTVNTVAMSTVGFTCLALFYQSLLLLAVLRVDGWWARAMRFRPLMNLGKIAYCVYLTHLTVFDVVVYVLRGYPRESTPDWPAAVVALVLTIELARFSWRVLESKMIRLGLRLSRSTAAPT
jgi:peptidoglycan/LPS O-acetylase OafA/YrhL